MPKGNMETKAEAIERFRLANDKKTFDKRMVDETNAGIEMGGGTPAGQVPGSSIIDDQGVAKKQNIANEDMDFFTAIKSGNAERAQALLDKGEFVSGVMPEALEADELRNRSNRQLGIAETSKFADAAKSVEDPRQGVDIEKLKSDTAIKEGQLQENVDAGKARRSTDKATLAENRRLNDEKIDQIRASIKGASSEQIRSNANEIAIIAQEIVDREIAIFNEAKKNNDKASMRKAVKSMEDVNGLMKNNSIIIQKDINKYLLDRLE